MKAIQSTEMTDENTRKKTKKSFLRSSYIGHGMALKPSGWKGKGSTERLHDVSLRSWCYTNQFGFGGNVNTSLIAVGIFCHYIGSNILIREIYLDIYIYL